jgi:hypothetical protein
MEDHDRSGTRHAALPPGVVREDQRPVGKSRGA